MGLADTFTALSDHVRRSILTMLKNEALTAGVIACRLSISPAALSYHLSQLKKADLLTEYKVKNYVYYELNSTLFDELILWIKQFENKERPDVSGQQNVAAHMKEWV